MQTFCAAAGRAVFRAGVIGGEVLWRFGEERMGRNMFGLAGLMVGKDGVVVARAGCVRGGGGAGDCGGGR